MDAPPLFRWRAAGSNADGALGVGHARDVAVLEVVVVADGGSTRGSWSALAAGGRHTVAITPSSLWACGDLASTALLPPHSGGAGSVVAMQEVPLPPAVVTPLQAVAAGWASTAVIDATGTLHVASDVAGPLAPVPLPCPGRTVVMRVACGYKHTVAIAADGTAWVWGHSRHGALGLGEGVHDAPKPVPLPLPAGAAAAASAVACGMNHTAVVLSDGSIATAGSLRYNAVGRGAVDGGGGGDSGGGGGGAARCGGGGGGNATGKRREARSQGTMTGVALPAGCTGVSVAAGWHHTAALCRRDGATVLVMWGRCDLGQLGYEVADPTVLGGAPPRVVDATHACGCGAVPPVSAVACGSDHTVVALACGCVGGTGWNEHGALAVADLPSRAAFTCISRAVAGALIAAGGATTFIGELL